MGVIYDNELTNASGYITRLVITDDYLTNGDEYREELKINYRCNSAYTKELAEERHSTWGTVFSDPTVVRGNPNAFYIDTSGNNIALYACNYQNRDYTVTTKNYRNGSQEGSSFTVSVFLRGYGPSYPELGQIEYGYRMNYAVCEISTNIPIFRTLEEVNAYLITGDMSNAINYGSGASDFTDETVDYYCYNRYDSVSIERGIVTVTDSTTHQNNERVLYNGYDICLYRKQSNKFALALKVGRDSEIVGSYYSNTETIDNVDYNEFSDEIIYYDPFYTPYDRKFEIYDYVGYMGIGLSTNLPIWENETLADEYIAGNIDVTQCENWDKISNNPVWKKHIKNTTGDEETQTDMGKSYAQNYFSQLYLCASGGINQIASSLYDVGVGSLSGLWDEIKKGVEMYGDDPMQSVQGLMFFPLDLSSVYQNVQDQNYVYFGGYKLDLETNVKKIIFPNGYKSLGSITIRKSFNDWRDYEPYTKLYVYLPYVGTFQLQLSRYYGKSTEIRYYFDLRTGSCLVALLANGVLTDYFNGQLGVQLPITLTDKSAYANSQVNTLLKGASSMGSVVADVSAGIAGGASIPITGAFGALQAGVSVVKTIYDITQNNKTNYNKTTGGSTSMLNEFLPQYVYFIFEIQETIETDNLEMLQGYPSNESGNVGKFSGYLEVESVNLICGTATDNEKRQITQALYNGIII